MMDMKDSDDISESDVIVLSPDNRYISDTIIVSLIPEKKGTFLKHTEYEITSEKHKSKVERRYNDFALLYNLLMSKYANRMIPRLPPKQLMLDSFLEERRSGLERWLRLMSHHQLMASDELFKVFLTDMSDDHQNLLQEKYSQSPDEFLTLSNIVKLPKGDVEQVVTSREKMRVALNQVVKLKRLMEQQAKREINQSRDFAEMSLVLNSINCENNESVFKDFSANFTEASKESENVSLKQQRAVMERLVMIIDVATAHSYMCDRVEKSIASDHQTLSKTLQLNKQKIRDVIRGSSTEDVRMANEKQQSELDSLAQRNTFAIHCVTEETKFAEKYLKLLPSILLQFANEEAKGFKNISEILSKIVQLESDKMN